MYHVELFVTPRHGVRDPQADAVEEALHGAGFSEAHVAQDRKSVV